MSPTPSKALWKWLNFAGLSILVGALITSIFVKSWQDHLFFLLIAVWLYSLVIDRFNPGNILGHPVYTEGECRYQVGDWLVSPTTKEVYELTAIGHRYCLVQVHSKVGGPHEFPRRIEEVNKYEPHKA